jgi:pimeloyl-ACP methyl ester carboxylesterase
MPFAEIRDDVKLYYQQKGDGDDLILISGYSANRTAWNECIESLSEKYRVTIFENRGSGQSSMPTSSYTIKDMSKDVYFLMEKIGISEAYIAGHSMGGSILLQLCIDHPEKVKKSIICSSFADFPKISKIQIEITDKLFEAGVNPELVLESTMPWIYSAKYLSEKKSAETLAREIVEDPSRTIDETGGQTNVLLSLNLSEEIKNISTPTMIIVGDEDICSPVSCSEYLHKEIKNSELKIFSKAGHMTQKEIPQEIVNLIKQFC